jgi:hypothetical protein
VKLPGQLAWLDRHCTGMAATVCGELGFNQFSMKSRIMGHLFVRDSIPTHRGCGLHLDSPQTELDSRALEIRSRRKKNLSSNGLGLVRSDLGGPIGGPSGGAAMTPCDQLTGRLGHAQGVGVVG